MITTHDNVSNVQVSLKTEGLWMLLKHCLKLVSSNVLDVSLKWIITYTTQIFIYCG